MKNPCRSLCEESSCCHRQQHDPNVSFCRPIHQNFLRPHNSQSTYLFLSNRITYTYKNASTNQPFLAVAHSLHLFFLSCLIICQSCVFLSLTISSLDELVSFFLSFLFSTTFCCPSIPLSNSPVLNSTRVFLFYFVESYLTGVLRFILMAERNTARRERQYISQ